MRRMRRMMQLTDYAIKRLASPLRGQPDAASRLATAVTTNGLRDDSTHVDSPQPMLDESFRDANSLRANEINRLHRCSYRRSDASRTYSVDFYVIDT
jgi:hypothetical protein